MSIALGNRVQRLELELNEMRGDLDVLHRQNVDLRTRLDETLATVRALIERRPGSFFPDDLAESDQADEH